jgi:predicted Fe-Mo cluster-binding NifX family protein
MKVAVSATSGSMDAQIDPRFGRCQYFVIVDIETMNFTAIPNTSQNSSSGAGIQAAQVVANQSAKVVLTGNVGPNAFQALSAAGVTIITGVLGTVRDAIEKFKSGQLQKVTAPTTPMGSGMGGGRGRGGGRGLRRLTSQISMNTPGLPTKTTPQTPREREITTLETEMKNLQQQLDQITKRLKELTS